MWFECKTNHQNRTWLVKHKFIKCFNIVLSCFDWSLPFVPSDELWNEPALSYVAVMTENKSKLSYYSWGPEGQYIYKSKNNNNSVKLWL